MSQRSFLLPGAASFLIASAAIAAAARLHVSQVTVQILSVEPQSYQRDEIRRESFTDGKVSSFWSERTTSNAKALVKAVRLDDGHSLTAGAIIDIRYETRRGGGATPASPAIEVKAGETWMIDVAGGGNSFQVRGWTRPQADDGAAYSNVGDRH